MSIGILSCTRALVLLALAASVLPARGELLVESPRSGVIQIYRMADDGSGLRALTVGPRDNSSAVWSPDGRQIAFISTRDGSPQVYVMQADGSQQRRLSDLIQVGSGKPVWSPDGTRLAYPGMVSGRSGLVLIDVPTAARKTVPIEGADIGQLAWSPDGTELLYAALATGKRNETDLMSWSVATETSRLIVAGKGGSLSQPTWSSDSKLIAYVRAAGRDGVNIHVVDRAGQSPRAMTTGIRSNASPAWSPDGRWLAFESNRETGERTDVFVMPAAGGDAINLSMHEHEDFSPVWAHDSRSLYFVSFRTGTSQLFAAALDGKVSRIGTDPLYLGTPALRPPTPAAMASQQTTLPRSP